MKKKSMALVFAICAGGLLTMLAGSPRQVQAAMMNWELTGTVERKIRAAETMPTLRAEPGNSPFRVDRATAIIVDGNRMFILPETIVKKAEAIVKKNDGIIIDFNEMAVPCQAKIIYQQMPNGSKNVLEVHILSELAGATKKWAAPEPQ